MKTEIDVLIIGGGWSGIMACKYALQSGFTPLVLEKRSSFGGIWRFSEDPQTVTVMKTTETTSSRTPTEISDYPMRDEYGDFPKHHEILEYLTEYGDNFEIWRHFKFGQDITELRKRDDQWTARTSDGDTYQSKYVIIATGVHQTPNVESMEAVFGDFEGTLQHSIEVKEIDERYEGKSVLVYGGGESASDIVEQLGARAGQLAMSIPNGQHFFEKRKKRISPLFDWMVPGDYGEPLDKAVTPAIVAVCPPDKSKPGMGWMCRKTCGRSVFSYQGHGIPQWRSKSRFLEAFINKSASPVEMVQRGRLIPKRGISNVEGTSVTFDDGDVLDFDIIIACTGYRESLGFLGETLRDETHNLYKHIFNPSDPTMVFTGLIRPVILSVPGLAELQIRAVMKVWTGEIELPEQNERTVAAREERRFWDSMFQDSSRRIKNLVGASSYLEDLYRTFGFRPDIKGLLLRNPKLLFYLATSPYHAALSWLNQREHEEYVYQTLKKHARLSWQLIPIGLLITRILQVDRITTFVSNIMYRRQLARLKHNNVEPEEVRVEPEVRGCG